VIANTSGHAEPAVAELSCRSGSVSPTRGPECDHGHHKRKQYETDRHLDQPKIGRVFGYEPARHGAAGNQESPRDPSDHRVGSPVDDAIAVASFVQFISYLASEVSCQHNPGEPRSCIEQAAAAANHNQSFWFQIARIMRDDLAAMSGRK
jgi:hypothetical protein